MRIACLIVVGLLFSATAAQASDAKKLGEGPPTIDFNAMNVPVQGLQRLENRVYSLHVELYEYSMMPEACRPVPKIVDAAINDFRANPPQVTKRNKLDMVGMDMRMKAVVLRFMNPKLVKRVWLQEGASESAGGVADRLPNACR